MDTIDQNILRLSEAGETPCLATLIRASGSVPMSRRARMLVRADGSLLGTVGGGCLESEVHRLGLEVIADGRPRSMCYRLDEELAMATGMVCGGSVEIFLQPVGPAQAAMAREVLALVAQGGRGVLATVLSAAPNAAIPVGAQLLVRADGGRAGSTGDPALEAAIVAEAPRVLQGEAPVVTVYAPGAGALVAEGACHRPALEPPQPPNPGGSGSGMGEGVPRSPARRAPTAGAGPAAARVFLDPIAPVPALYLFGGGHVGIAAAQIASLVGMRVVVIDDRAEFANRERFPQADEVIVAAFDAVFERLALDESAYMVAVTRGHKHDETVIERALRTRARYIGMIGSRRKVKLLFDALRERGVSDEALARIHAPIGLEIGADTPEEIAVSILAEVIAVRRGRA